MEKLVKNIKYVLITIWLILIVFAVIWYVEPQWLRNISFQGRIVEGTENKLEGDEMLRQGEYEAAYDSYSLALKIKSTMQSAAIGKAIAAERLNREEEALGILTGLLEKGADKPYEIYYNLATIYEKKRNKEKTIEALIKTIETSPDPFDATVRLARLYFTSSQWKEALFYYRQAFESKPDLKNDYLTTLRKAEDIYNLDEELLTVIGKFLKKGFPEEVACLYYKEPYDNILKQDPVIARIYNDAGYCYAAMGDLKNALPFFQQAVKLQADNEEYRRNLERAQTKMSDKS